VPEYLPVAESQDVKIYCPNNGRYSFFNSPYPAHKSKSGIDLYSFLRFDELAGSPIEGRVTYIRKISTPKGREFVDSGFDVVILIEPRYNSGVVVKILHIDPIVEVGDYLDIGDDLGYLLRSGYYGWGTSPHIHLEIRHPNDPLRARGGYMLSNLHFPNKKSKETLTGKITQVQAEYALIELNSSIGLVGYVNGKKGILDGGIPYYGWLGFHSTRPEEGEISLNGKIIGDLHTISSNAGIGDSRKFRVSINKQKILGLSLYLSPKQKALIKAIPLKIGELDLEVGEEIEIKIN
jgi:hypothetical protein